jgi:hypothetical protein
VLNPNVSALTEIPRRVMVSHCRRYSLSGEWVSNTNQQPEMFNEALRVELVQCWVTIVWRGEVLERPRTVGPHVSAHAARGPCQVHALQGLSVYGKRPSPHPPRGGNPEIPENQGKTLLGKENWPFRRGDTCIRLVFRDTVHW